MTGVTLVMGTVLKLVHNVFRLECSRRNCGSCNRPLDRIMFIVMALFTVFEFAWFIAGAVWVLG